MQSEQGLSEDNRWVEFVVSTMRTPEEAVEQLMAEAPDEDWLRAVVDELDRALRLQPLKRLQQLWELSNADIARMFGDSRKTFSVWSQRGIPSDQAITLTNLSAATDRLEHYVKRERIPAVVRGPATNLGGRSLLDLACERCSEEVRTMVNQMFHLRRAEPG